MHVGVPHGSWHRCRACRRPATAYSQLVTRSTSHRHLSELRVKMITDYNRQPLNQSLTPTNSTTKQSTRHHWDTSWLWRVDRYASDSFRMSDAESAPHEQRSCAYYTLTRPQTLKTKSVVRRVGRTWLIKFGRYSRTATSPNAVLHCSSLPTFCIPTVSVISGKWVSIEFSAPPDITGNCKWSPMSPTLGSARFGLSTINGVKSHSRRLATIRSVWHFANCCVQTICNIFAVGQASTVLLPIENNSLYICGR